MATAIAAPATPMMAQVFALKAEAGDALLLLRMGDFYEAFFDDAVAIADALDIALTHRGEHDGRPVPMCGVPVHAHEAYLARLVKTGRAVAIAEQMEDPAEAKKRGGKTIVKRAIVRVLTPGTLIEERLLDGRRRSLLAARFDGPEGTGIAWADVSTGLLAAAEVAEHAAADEIARLDPAELLVPDGADGPGTPVPLPEFDSLAARGLIEARFGAGSAEGFGRMALAALGALLLHVDRTARSGQVRLSAPARHDAGAVMGIDAATRASLEITRTMTGAREGSLLGLLDRCLTAAGARRLADDLAAPLLDRARIGRRLDRVAALAEDRVLRDAVGEELGRAPDMARALARVAAGRWRPTDLAAIRDGLSAAGALAALLEVQGDAFARIVAALQPPAALKAMLAAALADRPPPDRGAGGAIRDGHDDGLDALRRLAADGRSAIVALEARLREETGLSALKVRHNQVLGYHVEVPARVADALMAAGSGFQHRQTLGSAMRFDTEALRTLATQIAEAGERALAAEAAHLEELAAAVLAEAEAVSAAAEAIAALDRTRALAEVATDEGWVRPELTDGLDFAVLGGRHPVVEAALRRTAESFVPNDCVLEGDARLWLLTGPNMGGKSTFLRQNALIAILAQTGSFVPARAARIGLVDRLFSRVGASDNLGEGRSTFMVEMVETAGILRHATGRSLLLLDEVGRGTATWDGLALAWAILEALHARGSRTLFASHYHELTALSGPLEALALRTMRVKEWNGALVFLHEVAEGAAPGSFGLEVARLAGMPEAVVARAREVLARLEAGEAGGDAAAALAGLPLFRAAVAPPARPDAVRERLRSVQPDALSPREALDLVYALVALMRETD
jgi:DNA mismatch repair protein MutS